MTDRHDCSGFLTGAKVLNRHNVLSSARQYLTAVICSYVVRLESMTYYSGYCKFQTAITSHLRQQFGFSFRFGSFSSLSDRFAGFQRAVTVAVFEAFALRYAHTHTYSHSMYLYM